MTFLFFFWSNLHITNEFIKFFLLKKAISAVIE